jgi:glucosylceramidase
MSTIDNDHEGTVRQVINRSVAGCMRSARFNLQLLRLLCLFLGCSGSLHVATAQVIDVYVSSKAGDRLTKKPRLQFEPLDSVAATFTINDAVQYQTIIGFGASFLEAGLITLDSLPHQKQEQVLRSLFDPKSGAGFTAMKTVIGSTDFMSAGPFYTYDDVPDDTALKHFSIRRDLRQHGLVTYIKRAQRYGSFVLQATMDYPPDWMLIDVAKNQDVNPTYYDALARYYLRYILEYEKQGIVIDYLSPFNEPTGYTKITYPELRDFIKNHLGPAMMRSAVKTKLQVSDNPGGRPFALNNIPIILDDPEARKYISTISYHGYDFGSREPMIDVDEFNKRMQSPEYLERAFSKPPTKENGYDFAEFKSLTRLHEKYPDLPLWMSEVCYADWMPRMKTWMRPLPKYDFEDGDFWGQQLAADLEAGASGWTYWNMILDQKGGPALVAPEHGDPAYNVQHPVVIIDRQTKQITYTGLYYYLAHFSKYVRPGAHRINISGSADGVKALAFKNADGSIVVQAINTLEQSSNDTVRWRDRGFSIELPAKSISTYLWKGDHAGQILPNQ